MDVEQFEEDLKQLAPRELQVMGHVGRGETNPQIAKILGLSRKTIENTIVRANKKFSEKLSRSMFILMWMRSKR